MNNKYIFLRNLQQKSKFVIMTDQSYYYISFTPTSTVSLRIIVKNTIFNFNTFEHDVFLDFQEHFKETCSLR